MEENVKQIIVRKDGNKTIQTRKIWQYDVGHELVFEGFDTLPEVFQVHFSHSPAGEAQTQIGQNCVCRVPDIYVEKAAPIYAWIYVAEEDTGLTKQEIEIPVGRKSKPNDQEPEPVKQSAIDQAIAALNAGVERAEDAAEAAEAAQAGAEAAEQGASAAEDSAGASAALAAQKAELATREADRAEAAEGIVEQAARDAVEDVTEVAEQAATDLGGIVRDAQTQITGSVQQAQQAAQAASGSATAAAGSAGAAAGSATAADQSAQAAAQKKEQMDVRADEIEDELTSLMSALSENVSEITSLMVKHESHNLCKSDSEFTLGYMGLNGKVYDSTSLAYSTPIPVSEGDVIRAAVLRYSAFGVQSLRFVTAFSNGVAVSSKGSENGSTYTVPEGVDSIVITTYPGTNYMITKDYVPTSYEAYFEPYYTAGEGFVEEKEVEPEVVWDTVKGHNLVDESMIKVGAYTRNGTNIVYHETYTSYRCFILDVKSDTYYSATAGCQWYVYTDENDTVLSGERASLGYFFNTGNAKKLYYTINANDYDNGFIIVEGIHRAVKKVDKPVFMSGINANMHDSLYGCALPPFNIRFTVGKPVTIYDRNVLSLDSMRYSAGFNSCGTRTESGYYIDPTNATTSNGYTYAVYDEYLAVVEQKLNNNTSYSAKADNLADCSVLVIGDSTVNFGTMTQKMLDEFAENGVTLTLLGTRGTGSNKHEGRSGWSTATYMTGASYEGAVNPFYNPTAETFDFSYYMTNQEYDSVDFIVIQLGINDLYNTTYGNIESEIQSTANRLCTMIDSILEWNPSQKILLNLPTPCNTDRAKVHLDFLVMAKYIKYNQLIQLLTQSKYGLAKVRPTLCHLILDGSQDINDNIHPNTGGFTKMASEVVSQINCWQNA